MSSTSPPLPPPPSQPQPPPLIPTLPDDVASNIIARIPRWHHPVLSAVSKPLRSLLLSPLFFTARSLLSSTDPLLYLTLRSHHPHHPSSWFTLLRPPSPNDAVRTKPLLTPVPPIPVPSIGSCYAVLGPKIYVIGGSVNDVPSSHVWVLDCRYHTWEQGPTMRIPREFAAAGVVGGKIYVMGGCSVDSWARATHWAEVFDLEEGKWRAVQSPVEVRDKWMHASAVVGERVFAMADRGGVVFDAKSGVWEGVESGLDLGWRGRACVVNGVLYCYDYLGKIRGFGFDGCGAWRELKAVEKGLPKFLCGATMANMDGKLVVVWEEKGNGKDVEIWCAEIEVSEDEEGNLCGEIGWSSKVLSAPVGSSVVHCMAVSL